MSTIEHQALILQRLAEHEAAIAVLYALFKDAFRWDAAFWGDLEAQERMHAEMLRELRVKVKAGQGTPALERLTPQTIEHSLDFVKQHIDLCRKGKIRRRTAVEWALNIEQLLLEDHLPEELCSTNDSLTSDTFTRLRQETVRHRQQLEKARRRLRNPFLFFLPLPGN